MSNKSLIHSYCPRPHNAPITAAKYDSTSNSRVTADAWGCVAVFTQGSNEPEFVEQVYYQVTGAVAISDGGALVAVGDDGGSIRVYRVRDQALVFEHLRDDGDGSSHALRALAFNPQGTLLATQAVDGILRIYDIQHGERVGNYKGYSGLSIQFGSSGKTILTIDSLGQPKLLNIELQEEVALATIPGGCIDAVFTPDGNSIVVLRENGMGLISLPGGLLTAGFSAKGASGMLGLEVNPKGDCVAALTERSAHLFSLPDLKPVKSIKHGADQPTGAAIWDKTGLAIADAHGAMYRPDERPGLDPIVCAAAFGENRLSVHGQKVTVWTKSRQKRPFKVAQHCIEAKIDRDGRLLLLLPEDNTGVQIYEARTGRLLFDAGPDTAQTTKMEVGGPVVAAALTNGGVRWYDLKNNQVYELPWVKNFAVSGSGTWLAVTTPQGGVRILDPATGQPAIPDPVCNPNDKINLIAFVNRRPELIALTENGQLQRYNLAPSVTDDRAAEPEEIIDLHVPADAIWGITGGKTAAVRIQEEDETATIITVDLSNGEVIAEANGLLPYVTVDPETGNIIQPETGNAIAEYDSAGTIERVYRALPEGEWIIYTPVGIAGVSANAGFK